MPASMRTVLSAISAAVVLGTAAPALACSCRPDITQVVARSDLIAIGRVVEAPADPGGTWRVRIDAVQQGDADLIGRTITLGNGPATCTASFPDSRPFRFAALRRDASYHTDLCLMFWVSKLPPAAKEGP